MALTKVTMGLLSGLVDKITMTVKSLFNAGGDAPMFACRAWVHFGASATVVNIYGSGNIASIQRLATGQYRIYFITPMPTTNYAASVEFRRASNWTGAGSHLKVATATFCEIQVVENNVNADSDSIHVLIFC